MQHPHTGPGGETTESSQPEQLAADTTSRLPRAPLMSMSPPPPSRTSRPVGDAHFRPHHHRHGHLHLPRQTQLKELNVRGRTVPGVCLLGQTGLVKTLN